MSTVELIGSNDILPLRTLEETTKLLKASNASALVEDLRLCWREPGQIKKDSISAGLLHKKNLASLERALKKTPSSIKSLSVGWKHGGSRKPLIKLIELFAHRSGWTALQDLESIELVLATWVPDTTLVQLLMPYASQLKTLHIQATRMKIRTKKPLSFFKNTYQTVHSVAYVLEEESVVKLLATPTLASQLTNLTTLSFVDCDILDAEVEILVRFLWHYYWRHGLRNLNLRSNRHMSPRAIQRIVQAPVSGRLDLSLCDITNAGAVAIARAMHPGNRAAWRQQHNVVLEELSMRGNYRLDERGFVPLARICPNQIQQWDMSYCEWNEHQTLLLLEEMTPSTMARSCPLKALILEGARINNAEACHSIRTLLQTNRSLVKLSFQDPKYPMPISLPHLNTLLQGLRSNYILQELDVDLHSLKRQQQMYPQTYATASQLYNEMNFYLELNRAGRVLLQQEDDSEQREATMVALLKARQSGRLDVLYWLLRNGVATMF
jgi:hypothetical protein